MKIFKTTTVLSFVIFFLLLFFHTSIAFGDVTLNNLFTDNMVLQQQSDMAVWGWAEPGEKVEVKASWQWLFGVKTVADKDGKWKTKIPTPKAGGPYTVTVKGKDNTIKLQNVMTGEVWLCSGQSNMWLPLRRCDDAETEITNANYPDIRFFTVPQVAKNDPQENCTGKWEICIPETAKDFSATAYHFGRELQAKLNVPVGLIHASWGGTPCDAWTSEKTLRSDPELGAIFDVWKGWEDSHEKVNRDYEKELDEWSKSKEKAKKDGSKSLKKPGMPEAVYNLKRPHRKPSSLYNGMIAPLVPYTIKGVIWNQASANRKRAYQYDKLFPSMIKNWRSDWELGDIPFYFVQMATFSFNTMPLSAPEIREAQLKTFKKVANTGMVVTMDIGNPKDIHPTKKKITGTRLSLWALARTYGFADIVYSGPIFESMQIEKNKAKINFEYTGSGLMSKDGALKDFIIAGKDKVFFPAKAEIDGKNILVSSEDVKKPVAVRYAWTAGEIPNFFNKEGLPASPFRTDDWPMSSEPMEESKRRHQVYVKKDVPYLGKGRKEKLDLYYPADADKNDRFPGVVIIHGGGWVGGDKARKREINIGGTLAKAGYVCASINYALLDGATWQEIIFDCKNAVRFLRVNAKEYKIDSEHIGVIGGSAGGHLSLMLAFTSGQKEFEPEKLYPGVSSRIQAAVDMYGITNLLTRQYVDKNGKPKGTLKDGTSSRMARGDRDEKPEIWKLLSPVNHISKDDPPVLILHGTKDTTVCYTQSEELAERLKAVGHPYELHMLEGIGHTFDLQKWNKKPLPKDLRPIVIDFFDKYLKN